MDYNIVLFYHTYTSILTTRVLLNILQSRIPIPFIHCCARHAFNCFWNNSIIILYVFVLSPNSLLCLLLSLLVYEAIMGTYFPFVTTVCYSLSSTATKSNPCVVSRIRDIKDNLGYNNKIVIPSTVWLNYWGIRCVNNNLIKNSVCKNIFFEPAKSIYHDFLQRNSLKC